MVLAGLCTSTGGAREGNIPGFCKLLAASGGAIWQSVSGMVMRHFHGLQRFVDASDSLSGWEVLDRLRKSGCPTRSAGVEPFGPRVNALTLAIRIMRTAQAAGAVALLLVASSTRAASSDLIGGLRAIRRQRPAAGLRRGRRYRDAWRRLYAAARCAEGLFPAR